MGVIEIQQYFSNKMDRNLEVVVATDGVGVTWAGAAGGGHTKAHAVGWAVRGGGRGWTYLGRARRLLSNRIAIDRRPYGDESWLRGSWLGLWWGLHRRAEQAPPLRGRKLLSEPLARFVLGHTSAGNKTSAAKAGTNWRHLRHD
jgi:hypothetical protein